MDYYNTDNSVLGIMTLAGFKAKKFYPKSNITSENPLSLTDIARLVLKYTQT